MRATTELHAKSSQPSYSTGLSITQILTHVCQYLTNTLDLRRALWQSVIGQRYDSLEIDCKKQLTILRQRTPALKVTPPGRLYIPWCYSMVLTVGMCERAGEDAGGV